MSEYHYVGVDIAKDKFDVSLSVQGRRKHTVFKNNRGGFQQMIKRLKASDGIAWVCMEATGIYGEELAETLTANKIKVSVVNPTQVKYFTKALLQRNKNDKVDADAIARYVEQAQPELYIPKTKAQKVMRELVQMLECLTDQLTQWKNKLHASRTAIARKEFEKEIARLVKRKLQITKRIQSLVQSDPILRSNFDLITSIKGVGEKLAFAWLAHIPNIGSFNSAKQLAAYIGVSPKQHESGYYKGQTKLSKIGNAHMRKALYMPALSAKRTNEHLQPFVHRLELSGHSKKQIVGAVMRKLVHLIFGILKSGLPFNSQLC